MRTMITIIVEAKVDTVVTQCLLPSLKVPIGEAIYHYLGVVDNTMGQSVIGFQMNCLGTHYSEFRPVHSDGDCFYRSFIFSYLEQVVDRVDTCEEDRLLAAIRKLATKARSLGWDYIFSLRCKAFETLIKKIKGWKCKRMWEYPTSIISYNRGKFLLKLFRSDDTANDSERNTLSLCSFNLILIHGSDMHSTVSVFAFLRLATAIWVCSNRMLYERRMIGPIEDWCLTQVIPPHVHVDDIAIGALCRALGVAVQVEDVISGSRIDVLGAELQSAIQVLNGTDGTDDDEDLFFIGRDMPHVTLVQLFSHYDILYPLPLGAIDPKRTSSDPTDEASSGVADQTLRNSTAEQSAGSQQPSDPEGLASKQVSAGDTAAETSSPRAVRWSCWCFLFPKKSPSQGSTSSTHSRH
uniref:OTU domain-containing protein n=1 Tax=Oryza punctata TaxID=4537 RepID=A0A0E0LZP3_ORYPU